MSFALDPRIAATSEPVARLALCEVRLQADARWPWLVLIPQRTGLTEIEQLTAADRAILMEEVVVTGAAVRTLGSVEKLNVGALGNVVPQLHMHVVGRRRGDANWPGPVWGHGSAQPYTPDDLRGAVEAARAVLGQSVSSSS